MDTMKEDNYLVSFFILIALAMALQYPPLIDIVPALNMIDSLVLAAIVLIGLIIGLYGQYRNPIDTWGSIMVSIGLVVMAFFLLPWSYHLFFASLGIIPYIIGLFRQKQESEKQESSTLKDDSLA